MNSLECFGAYAAEFEKTFADDDWTRLERFFAADAVYEVRGTSFACRLEGPASIFAGMKKSLDGFDRRMTKREIAITEAPSVDDDRVTLGWTVTYGRPGAPDFALRGRSTAVCREGRIVELVDVYGADVDAEVAAWASAHGADLDPSYL